MRWTTPVLARRGAATLAWTVPPTRLGEAVMAQMLPVWRSADTCAPGGGSLGRR